MKCNLAYAREGRDSSVVYSEENARRNLVEERKSCKCVLRIKKRHLIEYREK